MLALGLAAGCQRGLIGDPPSLNLGGGGGPNGPGNPGDPNNPGNPNMPVDPATCAMGPARAGPAPLRRLTNTEYSNIVAALFSVQNSAGGFPDDPLVDGYDNAGTANNITQTRADQMMSAVQTIAGQVASGLAALVPCPLASADDTCALNFIKSFGLKMYRRPLAADEIMILKTVWDQSAPISNNVTERFQLVIETMLMSPQFIYKVETGDPSLAAPAPGLVQLSAYEIASRLSFFIWSSAPDDALYASAASGKLNTKQGVADEAHRMLSDDRAKTGVANFMGQWFELYALNMLDKDTTMFPQWTPALRDAVGTETRMFFQDLVFARHGSLKDLLTAKTTFVNSDLARLYGLQAVPAAQGFVQVTLPDGERKGVLTQASFLATHAHGQVTSPVRRGLFIRRKFLCQDLPPPPNNIAITIPTPDPNSTNRQRMSQHDSDPACHGCHQMMDPVGFGFESFDAIGQHQTKEGNGLTIDSSGMLIGTNEIDGPFNGALELIDKLAGASQVEQCMVTQTFRYAQGRRDTEDDACAIAQLEQNFHMNNNDLLGLMADLVQTDFFRYRPVVQ